MKTRNVNKRLDPAEKWLAREWLGKDYTHSKPENLTRDIKHNIFNYIYNILGKGGEFRLPTDFNILFKERRVLEKILVELAQNKSGQLIPVRGGFIIKLNSKEKEYRRERFTVAHEIGHTFFYDLNEETPVLPFKKNESRYWVQEGYANEIANAILLPEPSLRYVINNERLFPSLVSIGKLCNKYEVSFEVLTRGIINRLGLWDCLVFRSFVHPNATFETDKDNTRKGKSFTWWNIPGILSKKTGAEITKMPAAIKPLLFRVLNSAADSGEFVIEEIRTPRKEFFIECALYDYAPNPSCITLITTDNRSIKRPAPATRLNFG